jgi:ribosome-binding protein aMBF1 (putative translation factor)
MTCESCNGVWEISFHYRGASMVVCSECAAFGVFHQNEEVDIREEVSQLRDRRTVDAR